MKRPFGTVTEFDQSWLLVDRVSEPYREAKYTVDPYGVELLRFRDSVSPELRRRDRRARRLSRLLALLPTSLSVRLVGCVDRALRLKDRVDEWVLERGSRRLRKKDGMVLVGSTWNPEVAVEVDVYDADAEEKLQQDLVLEALLDAGVAALVIPSGPGQRTSVGIKARELDLAFGVLADLDRSWQVGSIDTPEVSPSRITRRTLNRLVREQGGFRVFRLVAGAPGRLISGAEVGVDVEVWRDPLPAIPDPKARERRFGAPPVEVDNRLRPMRRQAWTHRISRSSWRETTAREDAHLHLDSVPHLFEFTEPIDVVYTWVDGADPVWNQARIDALGAPRDLALPSASTDDARFRSHDELRYSLRSLEMFAPWVRKVHIVTAGQTPYWLDVAHPRINLVDHREIFADPDVLPVFNSHAIESQLHRIPGLAEHYLYLNDDIFFGRPVQPELFFHGNGIAKFFPGTEVIDHGPREPHDDPLTSAAKNNRDLIEAVFGRTTTSIFQHTPHPQLRSVLERMEENHPELFAQVAASKFRHPDDLSISSSLHHQYAYAQGKALPSRLDYFYLDLGHHRAATALRRVLSGREFDVFCLNDSPQASGNDRGTGELLSWFLPRYFPLASTFELDTSRRHPTGSVSGRSGEHRPHTPRL